MLLGQSVFQSVIERLKAEEEEALAGQETAASLDASYRITGLNTGFVLETIHDNVSGASGAATAYRDFLLETAPPEPVVEQEPLPVMPPHLARLLPEEIIEELAIATTDTHATLAEKRREFARANHPDMVHPDFRDNATARMKIANRLIDEALRLTTLRS